MKTLLLTLSLLVTGLANAQSCRDEKSIGVDYYQAKYNCEVVLQGNAVNCTPYGSMWGCSCSICPAAGSGNFTRITGVSYDNAQYNCEIVLKGRAANCQPSVNNLWYCECSY